MHPNLKRISDARRPYRRSSGCPGPCCCGGFREPSVVPLPLGPFLSGSVCSVRARSLSRPGAAVDWLRHRRRRSLRAPMGACLPRPLHIVVYIRGARQVPELWGVKLLFSALSNNYVIKFQRESNVYVQEIVSNSRDDLYPSAENDGSPSRLSGYFSLSRLAWQCCGICFVNWKISVIHSYGLG